MSDLRAFYGPNAGYVLDLYDRYLADPASVDPDLRAFFADFTPTLPPTNGVAKTRAGAATAVAEPTVRTVAVAEPSSAADIAKIVGAASLAIGIREYGHLAAQIDPLGSSPPGAPELDPATHGISEGDLTVLPASVVGGRAAEGMANAAEATARLREIYSGTAGFDFDHVHFAAERAWLSEAVESQRFAQPLKHSDKRALLRRLTDVEAFEKFLHQTYLGAKRFSIEGNDMLVPILDEVVHAAAAEGTREIVVGMAHRGRLNVMTHVLGKPYAAVIVAFEGNKFRAASQPATDVSDDWSGDVKYHLGARLLRGQHGMMVEVPLVLAPNPSHLEAVNPVVEGMVRASQDITDKPGKPERDNLASMAILIHGDAAFPGQGVVAETLNLSALPGYTTGGTIHIIVNNQVGFTTDPSDARSTLYAGDLAKGFEIPVVHVNADDPEACVMATRLAMAYREEFGKDFLIDLVGYRRWGHNEGDEPVFTQPGLYEKIGKQPTVRQLWADRLVADGTVTADEPAAMLKSALDHLAMVRRGLADGTLPTEEDGQAPATPRREVDTAVPAEQLREYHRAIHAMPAGFTLSPKLARQWERRAAIVEQPDGKVDWAHAESLAFAAILTDGTPIRLTGQDAERGTFSQRHLVLHDPKTGQPHTPLQTLPTAQASFAVYNSPLSEQAAVGFEYGYSVHAPGRLVLWEAQFGDFSNGAQIVIDQFIAAARSKWRVYPALVMLLPHGYEGQGPEHSSARLERYLQLAAQDNIRVANCTTAAQYFHLLRRQAALLTIDPRPLILMTPKSLLRNPLAASPLEDLASGTFRPVLDDATAEGREAEVTRVVLCSGKVAVDLESSPHRAEATRVAVVRVEQLAPFQQTALRQTLTRYPNLAEVVWLQEEPQNMGSWGYMEPRLRKLVRELLGTEDALRYIGRPERASPAEGSADLHALRQGQIVADAFADAPEPAAKKTNGRATTRNTKNGVAAVANGQGEAPTAKRAAKARS
ncbi:MAG: 2-oxoglutarate dehydrogenase component [Thermomicrobiales bacterium]|nr:2-oxoglutarate dehydrogenase component [Thermomicrobiales bacterium]